MAVAAAAATTAGQPVTAGQMQADGAVALSTDEPEERTCRPDGDPLDDPDSKANAESGAGVRGGADLERNDDGATLQATDPKYPTGVSFIITFSSLIAAGILMALNASMLGTDVGWYGSAYLISNCAMLPLTGQMFAIFPVRHSFVAYLFIFFLGVLISGVAVSSAMLVVGRAICGIGGSGIVTGATAIITAIRPLDKRPLLIGILMGSIALGQVAGPLLGGVLAKVNWRWIFYINLPLDAIFIFVFIFVVRLPADEQKRLQKKGEKEEKKRKKLGERQSRSGTAADSTVLAVSPDNAGPSLPLPPLTPSRSTTKSIKRHAWLDGWVVQLHKVAHLDFVGFVCFAAGCALLLTGLEWGGTTYAWTSGAVIGPICAGGALFVVFVGWSAHLGDRALLPPRLLLHRRQAAPVAPAAPTAPAARTGSWAAVMRGVRSTNINTINVMCGVTALAQSGSLFILTYYLPIWFQGVKGASPIMSGVMLLPTIVSQLLAAFACGFIVQKTGYYLPELVFGSALVTMASGLFTTFTPHSPSGHWIGFQIMGGAGRGFVMQLLVTVIQANLPASDIPIGVSYVMFCQYFGGALFIGGARTLLTSSLGRALAKYAPHVDPQRVVNTGVVDLRKVFGPADLDSVILAYNESLVNVFYMQLGLSSVAFCCSWFLGWRDVRKKAPEQQQQQQKQQPDKGLAEADVEKGSA